MNYNNLFLKFKFIFDISVQKTFVDLDPGFFLNLDMELEVFYDQKSKTL
jgi:hypothetical protein